MGTGRYQAGGGEGLKFLKALLQDAPPECVTWPLFRDPNGYGRVGINGKQRWAHRAMCELAHGPAPADKSQATHSCGNGKGGCVNPRHLMWGTPSRNQLDRAFHGTKAKGFYRGRRRKLTLEIVMEIRSLKGKMTQRAIAAKFDISDATVRDIYSGKSWASDGRLKWREMTREEVAEIRRLWGTVPTDDLAKRFGVSATAIWRAARGDTYKDYDDVSAA